MNREELSGKWRWEREGRENGDEDNSLLPENKSLNQDAGHATAS